MYDIKWGFLSLSNFRLTLNTFYTVRLKYHANDTRTYAFRRWMIHNIYLLQVMKFGELVTVFSVLFLVTFSMGDGAPQWRPQGRFGKRLDQRFPSPWQQSKYAHNINFTLHLFRIVQKRKLELVFDQFYRYFTIIVKITFRFLNLFDHKLPSLRTLHMRYLKKKPMITFCILVLSFWSRNIGIIYFVFPQFPVQKKTSTFIPFWKNRRTYRPTMWTISLMC